MKKKINRRERRRKKEKGKKKDEKGRKTGKKGKEGSSIAQTTGTNSRAKFRLKPPGVCDCDASTLRSNKSTISTDHVDVII